MRTYGLLTQQIVIVALVSAGLLCRVQETYGQDLDRLTDTNGLPGANSLRKWLLKANAAFGDEAEVGYRKTYYLEDNDRMRVSEDTWDYDVPLSDKVQVEGNVTVDAISGATPTGAPPQTQWPFPSFANLYQTAYRGAYGSQYSQFIANNQVYVDAGLLTVQQLTNAAASYAKQAAGSIATNSAAASYQSLTNNPNYRNNRVPLTPMHDHRNAFAIGLPIAFEYQEITPSFAYSCESDYISFGGSLHDSLLLNQKNTTLSGGWSHNDDLVRDDTLIHWQRKMTDDLFLGLVQLFGPKAYLTANVSLGTEHGYLADPYRGVMLAGELQNNPDDAALSPEVRPRQRNSETLYVSWTQFVTPLNGSFEVNDRLFHDSWGIYASTTELDWRQKLGKLIVLSPMFRYYVQHAANFYCLLVPTEDNKLPSFYSSDYRLSEYETFTLGIAISCHIQKHLSLDFSYMRYILEGLDGATSQTAYPSANVFSFGLRGWF